MDMDPMQMQMRKSSEQPGLGQLGMGETLPMDTSGTYADLDPQEVNFHLSPTNDTAIAG